MNKEMMVMFKTSDLRVDTVGSIIEKRFLDEMIQLAEGYASQIMDDYNFLVSTEVKEIVLQDFMRVTKNIRTMKYVRRHGEFVPVLERIDIKTVIS